ncbi:DNA polymerase I [Aliikangiella coralliicola]|uniref:DNA polymerase I n=1 Tax=Aliikangiella coralliicola TaxID=2592383 RepID=A0A545UFR5_9GAMM|nr:DNA polymerase I [Aliikangiella coralliicola]TQV88312.1 DNA polymerase I [Aliikangiella coralliicola]
MQNQTPLILVDGSSYLFRAYHTMNFSTSAGQPTGAIYGVINMLKSLYKQYQPTQMAVIFDAKGKTFRNDLYPEYKAHRPPMPDDLRSQIAPLHQIVKAMGFPLISIEGVEADDVIGTLAHHATEAGRKTIISTGDKDMAQLVNPHISLINTMTNQFLDVEGVNKKFGIPPELIIDFLALMGDTADNIPGVAGVGEKTALGLLQGIGSIDEIYQNIEKIADLPIRGAKKLGEKMLANEEDARLSYLLATIKLDVELPLELNELNIGEADTAELETLFSEYEFKTWLKDVKAGKPVLPAGTAKSNEKDADSAEAKPVESSIDRSQYETILTEAQLKSWVSKLEASRLFAVDTETTNLNIIAADLVGISFATDKGQAAYLPLIHQYPGAPQQLDQEWALAQLKPVLENPEIAKIGQNIKYDQSIFAAVGIELQGVKFDTMLESYTLNSVANRHDMDTLSQKYLGHECIHYEEIAGKGKKQVTFDQIDLDIASKYAAEDADVTLQLHQSIWPALEKEEGPKNIFNEIEVPLINVLSKMERQGVLIDGDFLKQKSNEFGKRIIELEKKAHELAGQPFNLGSPKQLQEILFEKQGLPVLKKTPKKQPSTAEDVLAKLALDYPLPKVIMEYRGLTKLKSTYSDKLPLMVQPRTGRVHTSYHQAVAATGRLSSADPNLQNIPVKTEEGRKIREAFIAPSGYKVVAADYSQIELRIMAHLSQDENLVRAFADNLDIHKATAAEVFGVELDEVTSEHRRHAKAVNFGLIYGMSRFGLAKQLGITNDEAAHYIDTYFARYPGVSDYMESTKAKAKELGYVETLFGRRLYLPQINASNGMHRQAAERTAINAPMQGSAADIIKLAMIETQKWLDAEKPDCHMVMQVHDELVFEVAEDKVEEYSNKINQIMANAVELSVPLIVDVGVGENWEQAH